MERCDELSNIGAFTVWASVSICQLWTLSSGLLPVAVQYDIIEVIFIRLLQPRSRSGYGCRNAEINSRVSYLENHAPLQVLDVLLLRDSPTSSLKRMSPS